MSQHQDVQPIPDSSSQVESLRAQIGELQARLARNEKIRKTLMDRVERSVDAAGNSYSLFEQNILLEQKIRERTTELKKSETAYRTLFEQSHLNEQRLETLFRLKQMADEPLEVLCQFAMEEAVRLTGSTIGYLAFVSEDEKVMTMHAWSRSAMQECRIEDKPIVYPVEKTGLWGEAIRQRKPVITNDYSQPNPLKKGCPQGHVSVQRHMNAPIFDGDHIVIVAGVGNKARNYDETDIRQLTLLMQGMWNIIQRKKAEEMVRIERQRLASIIEGTHVGAWEWNVQTGETVFNERWAQIVGYTLAELEPVSIQTWLRLAHPDDLKESEAKLQKHFSGELECYDHECRMKHKDGSWIWVHDRGKVIAWTADGKPLRMSGTHSDITDRKRSEEALRESERKARAFFDSSFGFIGLLSPDGTVLEVNKSALDFAGVCMSDVKGKPFWDTIWWSHSPQVQEQIRANVKSAAEGTLVRGEATHLAKDGTLHIIDFTLKPVPDDTGRVVRLIAEGRDITDRKRAERELRAKEQEIRALVETSKDWIWAIDLKGNHTYSNAAITQILGYEVEEVLNGSGMVHRDDEDQEQVHQILREKIASRNGWNSWVIRWRHKDGSLRYLESNAVPILDAQGELVGFRGVDRDITDRIRAAQALQASEERHRKITNCVPDGIWTADLSGRFIYLSPAVERLHGWTVEEMQKLTVWDTVAPQQTASIRKILEDELAKSASPHYDRNTVRTFESEELRKDGSTFWAEISASFLWSDEGILVGIIGTTRDITERKRAEETLRQAMKAANAASVAKSQFLANMSHEIRTPMNAILGFADLLAQDSLTPQQADFVQTIRNSGAHLLNLINDILDFSKIEAGKMTLELADCSVVELLNEVESLMAPSARTKGLRFEMHEATALPRTLRTDPVRLRQCLMNLVNNAIKFTETGHVIVRTTLTEMAGKPFLRFEVEDTGPGIDPRAQTKIFEAFEQADGSITRRHGGTGLGLTITRHLAALFGGKLTLSSEPGKGSTFVIEIPTHTDIQNRSNQDRLPGPVPQEPSKPQPQRFQGRVLMAEDVKTNQMLARILLNQVGLEPMIVEDGQAAIEQVLRHEFDLILLDMQMPRLNGFEAARKLRKQGVRTPIVALTAGAIRGDEQQCREAGCDEYLTKPINRKELLRVLAKYLPAAAGLPHPA